MMPRALRPRSLRSLLHPSLALCLTLIASCTPGINTAPRHAPTKPPTPINQTATIPDDDTPLLATLHLRPIIVDRSHPARLRFGTLTLVAAYELTTRAPHFGGLSSLAYDAHAGRMFFISDRTRWFAATLRQDPKSGKLLGLEAWRGGPILGVEGTPLVGKEGDSEAIARHGETLYISFEQRHRVLRYDAGLAKAPRLVWTPPALARAPSNGGLEAMTTLPDGRLLLLCEDYRDAKGNLRGWIVSPEKRRAEAFSLVPSDGFRPTDLATLPSGDVLLVERAFSLLRGTRIRLRFIRAATLKAGARLDPPELLRLDRRHVVDNFEGLAVQRHASSGRLFIYLVSDDNFSRLQRTLLYQFALDLKALAPMR